MSITMQTLDEAAVGTRFTLGDSEYTRTEHGLSIGGTECDIRAFHTHVSEMTVVEEVVTPSKEEEEGREETAPAPGQVWQAGPRGYRHLLVREGVNGAWWALRFSPRGSILHNLVSVVPRGDLLDTGAMVGVTYANLVGVFSDAVDRVRAEMPATRGASEALSSNADEGTMIPAERVGLALARWQIEAGGMSAWADFNAAMSEAGVILPASQHRTHVRVAMPYLPPEGGEVSTYPSAQYWLNVTREQGETTREAAGRTLTERGVEFREGSLVILAQHEVVE